MSEGNFRQLDILCEGYDDRSFWAGWLEEHLDWNGNPDGQDAWGRPVKGRGRFLFEDEDSDTKLIVHPFQGRNLAGNAVREYLGHRQVYRPDGLVLNLDSDAEDSDATPGADLARRVLGEVDVEGTEVHAVLWECREPAEATPGVPTKQTLERLVSSAIHAAYPDRSPVVQDWLEAEPTHSIGPKNFSYSYLAKWYAEQGADDFFRALWRDEAVAAELRRLLEAAGAWDRVTGLLASG